MPEALNLGRLALPPTTALFCPITGFPAESEMLMRNLVVASALFGVHTSVCKCHYQILPIHVVLPEGHQGAGLAENREGGAFSPGRWMGTSSSESVPVEH